MLCAELHWFGDGKRFADTREIVTACDRALAEFGMTTGASYSQEILDGNEAKRGFPEASEFAMATVHGTPRDVADARIKVGLAANEQERVLDAEARGRQRAGEEG